MNAGFTTIDYAIFVAYAILIVGLGLWLSRSEKGHEKDSKDYFLAGGTLSWWAIGASLIAANISAEHFIGMSGSGFRIGLGIAAYEWIAAITLILVAKFLLPQMIEKKIFTMPQLANERYGQGVSFFFSFFWLLVYVFVNLTSVAWLGAIAMKQILGIPMEYGVPGLLIFAGIYSIYGGLKAVAWTDVIQVVFLVGGGLITAFFALAAVSDGNPFQGFMTVLEKVRETPGDLHFNMIIDGNVSPGIFKDLPGLAVIFGAMWLTNIGYWGFNQYIIQKGLAAKNLAEAKRGLIFAGYLKILIPIIVIIPGITAYVLFTHPDLQHNLVGLNGTIERADDAYPWLLRNFAPVGIRGLAFAALVAAVVSSLASMLNSTSTIFTLDIYKPLINKQASERQLVKVGRISALFALIIAMFAAKPLLGGLDQAFQYIQEYTGFIYPGVVVVFGMGILWKRATNRAALWTTIATLPLGIAMKFAVPDLPFIIRMGYVCMILISMAVILTLTDKHQVKADDLSDKNRKRLTSAGWIFAILSGITLLAGIVWGTNLLGCSLRYLGFHSIFMMTFMLAFLAIIMFTNAKSETKDAKSYEFNPTLFETDKKFLIGAIGIVVIIVSLYAYFW
ncbi:MAG TPA: sodium/glucose cotransporter [Marinilabiliales bacterium]|jgi:SSS family solute:Na+ symporter|nr:MAG: sodium/glucose cotransporter [Bacteroidetes bacterium GWA2_40_14]OFX58833.1 MAG: sodium/glucose cotransporter [Bacteroidetes bacterium GWC2_40_13]OFX73049.1 MAG: sodium/glucose cotransporter [Bacteroidetes bacterium GWD2_40_43]OFX91527.1 MAG: sodium/glucose cotransporter [Bacteroidetes bacterium GWE2_40_63]OFY19688.1 MAG: sodium/glucose cotransporter [Bacteroidetes bacterium GWF2_40_13]OFZ25469.1 MAG: sodium/glucose cotransporter [Bacteroidetes bacterium RIFOXYC2_FULL_40_12]HAN00398.1